MPSAFDDLDLDVLAHNRDLAGLAAAREIIVANGLQGAWGNTLLMHLASASTDVLKHLIDLGEDPATPNESGETVLHVCARFGYAKSMEMFVAWTHLVDAPNIAGATPLMAACEADFGIDTLACMRILLDAGANPNPTSPGDDGLMYCLCTGRPWEPEAVRLLAKHGTRVSQRNHDGANALTKSLSSNSQVMIPSSSLVLSLLESGAEFDEHSGQFERATRLAIKANDRALLERLNDQHGSVIAVRFTDGDSVLHEAFIHDSASACLCLLEMGIDPTVVNAHGQTVAPRSHAGPQCAAVMASFIARREAMAAIEEANSAHVSKIKAIGNP